MKSFELIIFDMDGLLIDSERIALEQFLKTALEFGIDIDKKVYIQCIGANARKVDQILSAALSQQTEYKSFKAAWREKYKTLITDYPIPLKEGVIELLNYIKLNNQSISIATSTETPQAELKLTNAGILQYFDDIIGGERVSKSKPEPDIFLKAAAEFKIKPDKCLALEDSENGVYAAISAGMKVVQIPDLVPPSDELKKQGHIILTSLLDVMVYRF